MRRKCLVYVPEGHPVALTLVKAKVRGKATRFRLRNENAWAPGETEICSDLYVRDIDSPIAKAFIDRFGVTTETDPEKLTGDDMFKIRVHVLRERKPAASEVAIDLDAELKQEERVAEVSRRTAPVSREGKEAIRKARNKSAKRII